MTPWGNEVNWMVQVFMVLSKRIVGAQQKNRRCSAKESSVLSKRIDDAKRKQSIYSQISLNCYAVGGSNTGQKHSKIIVFPLGFREVFSLLPSCLWIHPEQHHRDGRIRKRFLFFRWDSVPLWGLLRVFESFMTKEGEHLPYTPIAAMYG